MYKKNKRVMSNRYPGHDQVGLGSDNL